MDSLLVFTVLGITKPRCLLQACRVRELRGQEVEEVSSRAIFLPPGAARREGRRLSADKKVCAQDKPGQQRTAS